LVSQNSNNRNSVARKESREIRQSKKDKSRKGGMPTLEIENMEGFPNKDISRGEDSSFGIPSAPLPPMPL